MFTLGFENPWLLLAAIPLAVAVTWTLTRTESPLSSFRSAAGGVGLVVGALCLLLAAVQLVVGTSSSARTVIVLVDRSLSAGNAATARLPEVLSRLTRDLGPGDYLGVVSFSDTARMELEPRLASRVNPDFELSRAQPSEETWVRAALELASVSGVPGTSVEVLLIGDGHDSSQRYGMDLQRGARLAGVRVSALSVDSEPLPEVAMADFSARLAGREGAALDVAFVLYSTVRQRAAFSVRINGQPAAEQERDVDVGRNPVSLRIPLNSRLASYIVEVSVNAPQDTSTRNNSLKLPVAGPGEARVLLIHRKGAPEDSLEQVLMDAGMRVVMSDPSALPSDPLELARYQALILSDVAATDLPSGAQAVIEQFTRQGGGLAMIGGPRSFAPGGYYDTPVERALPVTCDVTEQGRKQIPALLMVLDRSGSMNMTVGGRTKMELANEGCALSVDLAPAGSYFGILAVDTGPDWVLNLALLKDKNAARGRAMSNHVGGGGIFCDVAMTEALEAIRGVKANSRHIVLFADGSDADNQKGVIEMVERARRDEQITVSVICMGRGADVEFLRAVAGAGKGRFELVDDASSLPAVFSRETAQAGGNYIREDPFTPVLGQPGALTDGVTFTREQILRGYIATTARGHANVLLWADEDKQRPLLACGYYGLGRSLAFMSDARDRWAEKWLRWEGYAKLWQRWIRWLLASPGAVQGVEGEWSVGREGPQLTLSFFDAAGEARTLSRPQADLTAPDGSQFTAPVLAVGPGRYRVQFSHAGAGVYAATVSDQPEGQPPQLAAREHLVYVPLDELRKRPADLAALNSLCKATGGRLIARLGDFLGQSAQSVTQYTRGADYLLPLGIAALLIYLSARRFPTARRTAERPRRMAETSAVSAAYERVKQRLEAKAEPQIPAFAPLAAPAPAPTPVVAPPPAPVQDGGLLAAVRKARKDRSGGGA
ncbi:MAG: VWA domain-containing protein [Planctomycetes bacterium]|nr:VWA domain-containing protein [Planctomycetota bacterium]